MSKWIKYELDSLKEENPYLPFRKEVGGKGIFLRNNVYLGGMIISGMHQCSIDASAHGGR